MVALRVQDDDPPGHARPSGEEVREAEPGELPCRAALRVALLEDEGEEPDPAGGRRPRPDHALESPYIEYDDLAGTRWGRQKV